MNKSPGNVLLATAATMAAVVVMASAASARSGMPEQSAVPSYKITKEVPLPGPDCWDFVKYSLMERRVYVAHGDRVSVVDEPTGKVIGHIGNLAGVTHGIAISPETHQGFATEGHPGLAVAFGLKGLRQTKAITTAPDADGYSTSRRRSTSTSSTATAVRSRYRSIERSEHRNDRCWIET